MLAVRGIGGSLQLLRAHAVTLLGVVTVTTFALLGHADAAAAAAVPAPLKLVLVLLFAPVYLMAFVLSGLFATMAGASAAPEWLQLAALPVYLVPYVLVDRARRKRRSAPPA